MFDDLSLTNESFKDVEEYEQIFDKKRILLLPEDYNDSLLTKDGEVPFYQPYFLLSKNFTKDSLKEYHKEDVIEFRNLLFTGLLPNSCSNVQIFNILDIIIFLDMKELAEHLLMSFSQKLSVEKFTEIYTKFYEKDHLFEYLNLRKVLKNFYFKNENQIKIEDKNLKRSLLKEDFTLNALLPFQIKFNNMKLQIFNSSEYSDFTIQAKNGDIKLHKFILRSLKFFNNLIKYENKNSIELNYDQKDLKNFFTYFYSPSSDLSKLSFADLFNMHIISEFMVVPELCLEISKKMSDFPKLGIDDLSLIDYYHNEETSESLKKVIVFKILEKINNFTFVKWITIFLTSNITRNTEPKLWKSLEIYTNSVDTKYLETTLHHLILEIKRLKGIPIEKDDIKSNQEIKEEEEEKEGEVNLGSLF